MRSPNIYVYSNDNLRNLGFHVNARFASANLPATSWRAIQFAFAKKKKKNEFYVTL